MYLLLRVVEDHSGDLFIPLPLLIFLSLSLFLFILPNAFTFTHFIIPRSLGSILSMLTIRIICILRVCVLDKIFQKQVCGFVLQEIVDVFDLLAVGYVIFEHGLRLLWLDLFGLYQLDEAVLKLLHVSLPHFRIIY